jgi:serine/tyrosine/threonine adenylyltransferase
MSLPFDYHFIRSLPGDPSAAPHSRQVHGALWSRVATRTVSAPRLLAVSPEVRGLLDISEGYSKTDEFLAVSSGNKPLEEDAVNAFVDSPGSFFTYATCYGGHQFGNWAGQLGDGRAILLGELVNTKGERFELQLKGAGPTPYSRRADGRAVLRSSIREYLCSEAMHHLGIPTTRALSLVLTGDKVERDMFYDGNADMEPGAIVCRVAPSFLRFGHYELPASRGDTALLKQLVDFTITNYFPEFTSLNEKERIVAWYGEVCVRTAKLMAEWMRVGFVHGVMNTDNMSILGLTIDYGPYGWIDNFDPGWTPNTTDAQGKRYCFGRQPGVAQWNLARLGDALATLAIEPDALETALERYTTTYATEIRRVYSNKFGLDEWNDEVGDLIDAAFMLMSAAHVDMTVFFRVLATAQRVDDLKNAFYSDAEWLASRPNFAAWFDRYSRKTQASDARRGDARDTRIARMNAANPKYVLRNYLAQEAIDLAHEGDYSRIHELLDVMRKPYDEQPAYERFAAKRPDWALNKAGCSMLSCSS